MTESTIVKIPFDIGGDSIFSGISISGNQGSGKTNACKALAMAIMSFDYGNLPQPTFIFLDSEGSFRDWTKISDLPADVQDEIERLGWEDPEVRVFKLATDHAASDSTMVFSALQYDDTPFVFSSMASTTQAVYEPIAKAAYDDLRRLNLPRTFSRVSDSIRAIINAGGNNIFAMQEKSIHRALNSVENRTLFDQPNKMPLNVDNLIQPGRIIVIDTEDLSDTGRLIAAIYLSQVLYHYKMTTTEHRENPVFLCLDELDKLLPKNPTKKDADFCERAESRIIDLSERSRKKQMGYVYTTHSPNSVASNIMKMPKIKIVFQLDQHIPYIKEVFGTQYITEISCLPTGTCRLKSTNIFGRQDVINCKLKFPRIHQNVEI